jgi:hypothetical protein
MNTNREASTGRETLIPILVVGPPDGSSTDNFTENYVKVQPSKPEPMRSDRSDPEDIPYRSTEYAY